MFYYLNGIVAEIDINLAVIDCGGVGYAVNTTANTLSRIKINEKAKLYICESIREDAFELYGFATLQEKRCFEMLLTVSGIGPKAAQSILSASTPEGLAMAIMNGNEKVITAAPGVGKKIAQRVILELKDKISKEAGSAAAEMPAVMTPTDSNIRSDAIAALMVLGYSAAEINSVLRGVDVSGLSTEQIVKLVLKNMM
ncbi:MAG: Holliday junction branch migration protein RuvA [Bacillota bacterium]|nr:Holliday junction branch migration protein RuvA [Bacillota bacterium]